MLTGCFTHKMAHIKRPALTKSYIHVPKRTPFTGLTVGQQFLKTANRNGHHEMYVFYTDNERKRYADMKQESQLFAAGLLNLGLSKGDTVAVWGNNHYEYILVYLAAALIGLIVVHMRINFPLHIQKETLQKLNCKLLVLTRSPESLFEDVCQILPELSCKGSSSGKISSQSIPSLQYVITANSGVSNSPAYSVKDVLEKATVNIFQKLEDYISLVDSDDPFIVVFTSGSVGFPKPVTHSHQALLNGRNAFRDEERGFQRTWERKLGIVTSFGGMAFQHGAIAPVLQPATTIFVSPTYDKHSLARAIHHERITEAVMLIHHINDIVYLPNRADYDWSCLELCLTGGSFVPFSLRQNLNSLAQYVFMAYSSSEILISCAQHPNDPPERINEPSFFPVGGVEIKIVDEDRQVLPVETMGEICVRSGTVFLYYWGDEQRTKAAKDCNGWYYTGDLGVMDECGWITIRGRTSERIVNEGTKVAPGDLEKVLDQHPDVRNVMVVGIPNERTSEEVCACIRLHVQAKITEETIREFCIGKVSSYLVPKYVQFFTEDFPTTPTGKFHRKALAEIAKQRLELNADA